MHALANVEVALHVGGTNFVFISFIGKLKLVNDNTFVKIFPAINKHLSSFPEEYKYSQKYNALEWFNLTREIDSGIIHVTAS